MARWHTDHCVDCGEELGEHEANFCLRCLHDPFPLDTKLRRRGFRLRRRPNNGPALWEREGELMTLGEALVLCREELKALETAKRA